MKKSVFLLLSLTALAFTGYTQTYYYQSGGTVSKSGQAYSSSIQDTSGVMVTNLGIFTLGHSTVKTSGNSSSTDNSSKYGLNAGVLAKLGSWIRFTSDTVNTSGTGANGLFATDAASKIEMTNGAITTGNNLAHGVDVTYGGTVLLTNVNVTTNGPSSSALATDFGGGTVTVHGGTIVAASTASGSHSAGIYSTGVITVSDATVTSAGDNGAVIDVDGSIILSNTNLTGALNGLMVHNTVGGSAVGVFTMNGGTLTAGGGDAFNTTGASSTINLGGRTMVTASSGNIVNSVNTGQTNFIASREDLTGNFVCDNTSTFTVYLTDTTVLTGSINAANTSNQVWLKMDATSLWNLTAKSYVPIFLDQVGVVNDSVINISGNGFDVVYDETNKKNAFLKAFKYKLRNGGWLTCPTCVLGVEEPAATSITLQCSPNPVTSVLNITVNSPLAQKISVYNTLGDKVRDLTVNGSAKVDVSNWANGLYFFRTSNSTERVIVMH